MTRDDDRVHAEIARAVQAGLAQPRPGFEHRLLAALREPPPSPRPVGGRLVAAGSVALAVLVVVGLLWVRPAVRGQHPAAAPAARPAPWASAAGAPTPAASPASTPGAPSATGFFYQSARPPEIALGPLLRADWSGAALPSMPAPNGTSTAVKVSPDGRYLTAPAGPEPSGTAQPPRRDTNVLDGSGAVVATTPDVFNLWADDSRHLCQLTLSAAGSPVAILIGELVPGSGVTTSTVPISGLPAWSYLAGCSFRNDRALLVSGARAGSEGPVTVYAVRLSTGEVEFHRDLPAGVQVLSACSEDGRYAAASTAGISTIGTSSAGIASDILDLDTGAVVAHVVGGVAGFSGDDQLVAVSDEQAAGASASLIEWRTGRTVWSQQASWILGGQVRTLPGAAAMALTIAGPGAAPYASPAAAPDVVLVQGDGTSTVIARGAVLLTLGSRGVG
jgi:hypothetical protein